MKASRRGFFGIGAGAIASAPAIAGQIAKDGSMYIQSAVPSSAYAYSGYETIANNVAPQSETDYLKSDLLRQEAALENLKIKPEMYKRHWRPVEAARLDSMRSLSPGAKARMMTEYAERADMAEKSAYISREILNIKERLAKWLFS